MPRMVAEAPPRYPTILMIPLALALKGFGVTSGIRATAGFLYIIMKIRTMAMDMTMPRMLL